MAPPSRPTQPPRLERRPDQAEVARRSRELSSRRRVRPAEEKQTDPAGLRRRVAAFALAGAAAAGLGAGVVIGAMHEPALDYKTAIASTYDDYGEPIACGGVLEPGRLGVAHKTLPCGTDISFKHNGRTVTVPVIDRGPYVAGREFDLTEAAAEELRFDGLGPVEWARAND